MNTALPVSALLLLLLLLLLPCGPASQSGPVPRLCQLDMRAALFIKALGEGCVPPPPDDA